MPARRRSTLLAMLAALAAGLAAPAAHGQEIPSPETLPPLTERPQAEEPAPEEPAPEEPAPEEPAPEEPAGEEPAPAAPRASELPNTGSDARVVALLGAIVLLTGLGLRLRTAPEHF